MGLGSCACWYYCLWVVRIGLASFFIAHLKLISVALLCKVVIIKHSVLIGCVKLGLLGFPLVYVALSGECLVVPADVLGCSGLLPFVARAFNLLI